MSQLEHIEDQVKSLTIEELRAFRDRFAAYDDQIWDRQIEDDATSGKLLSIAERALRGHESGRSTDLTSGMRVSER